MKLKLSQFINLFLWLFSVLRRIFAVEKLNITGEQKHSYVKNYIMPLIKKRGLRFTGDDVDRVINGLIWFLNKFVKKMEV